MTGDRANLLHVEFVLFSGDASLHGGGLLIGEQEGYACYGGHRHFTVAPDLPVVLFDGLLIRHRFEEPSCPVEMTLLRVVEAHGGAAPLRQERVFQTTLRLGVCASADWESITVAQHTLTFRCTPLRG